MKTKESQIESQSVQQKTSKDSFYAIDVAKFVCAMLVVTLHVITYAFSNMAVDGAAPTGNGNVLMSILMPLYFVFARIAVPFFFIASSYFLFKKIKSNPEKRKEIVKNYCLRIFKLLAFWMLVSLPILIDKFVVEILGGGGIWHLVLKTLFQGVISGGWYLVASIISALLVDFLSKYSVRTNVIIAIVFYIVSCLFSTYFNIFSFLPNSQAAFATLKKINLDFPIYRTFLSAFIFVLIGRLFAEKEKLLSDKLNKVLLFVCPILMFCELFVAIYFSLNIATDCFFTLVPASIVFFQFIKGLQLKPRKIYAHMRKWSTFMYMFHFVFLYVFYRLVQAYNWTIFISNVPMTILVYLVIIALSIGFCELASFLSKKKGLKFLKYSM